MRTKYMPIIFTSLLTFSATSLANESASNGFINCSAESSFAIQMLEQRLDGRSKESAERGLDPSLDETSRRMYETIQKVYAYDISSGSVEEFQEQFVQDCVKED